MGKHAYLIMAHNEFYILEKLLKLIDDERNDIYLHIDKKAKNFNFDKIKNTFLSIIHPILNPQIYLKDNKKLIPTLN